MTNLEFINKDINNCKKKLNDWKNRINCAHLIEPLQTRIKYLQQIKNILEAWEVVKPKIKFEDLGEMQNGNMYRGYFDDCFDEEEYNKTEKALEVKDEI